MQEINSTLEDGQAATPEVELSLRETINQVFDNANDEIQDEVIEDNTIEDVIDTTPEEETIEYVLPNETKSWNDEERAAFVKLREVAPEQADLLFENRFGKINSAFHEKSEQLADYRRRYDAIGSILEPHEEAMARAGMTPVDAINKLMAVNNQLAKDPQAAIIELAKANGVSLTDLVGGEEIEDDYTDPEVQALRDEIASIKTQQTQSMQQATQAQQNQLNQSIQTFASTVDDSGNLSHPHFDVLEAKMTELATKGVSSDLQELYDISLSMNVDLRSEVSKPVTTIETAADKQAKVDKAKIAGRTVKKGKVTADTDESMSGLSLREQLKRNGL